MEDTTMKVGIDVGHVNTDAVVLLDNGMEGVKVLSTAKVATTDDVTSGVCQALQLCLSSHERSRVQAVCIGTTHFINAILQRRNLARVAVLRLGRPSTRSLPPFTDWPKSLEEAIRHEWLLAGGGFNYDGSKISDTSEQEVKNFARRVRDSGCRHFAVVGVFSPSNPSQELLAESWIHEEVPDARVTASHLVGPIGFLERENAAILNESLRPMCVRTLRALSEGVRSCGLECPVLVTQNDGTVASASEAVRLPVTLLSSGPTNSMRGAARLTGVSDGVVVDVGGTTTDVGLLVKGFPKEASTRIRIGGVSTSFRMPEVTSLALGGGSVVRDACVGPDSVGHRLRQEAVAFGGCTVTLTDAAVACGVVRDVGDSEVTRARVEPTVAAAALATAKRLLTAAVESARVSKTPTPILLVGGGADIFSDMSEVAGMPVTLPTHANVANAVGAALCDVAGKVEATTTPEERAKTAERLRRLAVETAVSRGAAFAELTDFQEIQLRDGSWRSVAMATGPVDTARAAAELEVALRDNEAMDDETRLTSIEDVEISPTPRQIDEEGAWLVSDYDCLCLSVGAGLLGCGGGGSPTVGRLMLRSLIHSGVRPTIVPVEWLERRRQPDGRVLSVALMGSPTVVIEKLPSGEEVSAAIRLVGGDSCVAVAAVEVGGMNSMQPLLAAADLQLPVINADGMGRAFPEIQMLLPLMLGHSPSPSSIANEFGEGVVINDCKDAKELENRFREICVKYRAAAGVTLCPLRVSVCSDSLICGSYSRAWKIGDCVLRSRIDKTNVAEKLCNLLNGIHIVTGRIADVTRRTTGGFAHGHFELRDGDEKFEIVFQNEFLLVRSVGTESQVLVSTPDLVVVMDADNGEPVMTEELRYGLRVTVLAVPSEPKMATSKTLEFVGPQAFGLDGVEYRPCSEYSSC